MCIPIILTKLIVVVFIQLNEKNNVIRKCFKSQKIKDNSLKTIQFNLEAFNTSIVCYVTSTRI